MNPLHDPELRRGVRQGVIAGLAMLAIAIPLARHASTPAPRPGTAGTVAVAPAVAPSSTTLRSPTSPAWPPTAGSAGPLSAPWPTPGATLPPPALRHADFGPEPASAAARRVAAWAVASGDPQGRSFAIVDKRHARVYVFEASGRLLGATPVLLGYAAGDDSVPGIGQRPIAQVRPSERTTPAGRFVAEPGRNARDEDVVWVDYQAAVSMHRVLTTNPKERRLQRLATPTARDNRISYGCINVPAAFFDRVLWPALGSGPAVVYVLPEVHPLANVFPGVSQRPNASA